MMHVMVRSACAARMRIPMRSGLSAPLRTAAAPPCLDKLDHPGRPRPRLSHLWDQTMLIQEVFR